MPDQTLRRSYVTAKGGFGRFLWKPTFASSSFNLVALPTSVINAERDPNNIDMTEADSIGMYEAPTLERNQVSIDLRRRVDPISLDALGIRFLTFLDFFILDIGLTGMCDIWAHMTVGPYRRSQDQKVHITEGFSLTGGAQIFANVALPTWALPATGGSGVPLINGYVKSGVSVPSNFPGV